MKMYSKTICVCISWLQLWNRMVLNECCMYRRRKCTRYRHKEILPDIHFSKYPTNTVMSITVISAQIMTCVLRAELSLEKVFVVLFLVFQFRFSDSGNLKKNVLLELPWDHDMSWNLQIGSVLSTVATEVYNA